MRFGQGAGCTPRNAVDVHDKATRSRNMAAIRGRNTKPELLVRKLLHAHGLRFRLHNKALPGKPDLSFPKHCAVVFVNGCFWHGHDCAMFRWPKSRSQFWRDKIGRNVERDARNLRRLQRAGWRVAVVWECALKGPLRLELDRSMSRLANWIRSARTTLVIRGR